MPGERHILLVPPAFQQLHGALARANDSHAVRSDGGLGRRERARIVAREAHPQEGDDRVTDLGPDARPWRRGTHSPFDTDRWPRPSNGEVVFGWLGGGRRGALVLRDRRGRAPVGVGAHHVAEQPEAGAIERPREVPGVPSRVDAELAPAEDVARVVLDVQYVGRHAGDLVARVDRPKARVRSAVPRQERWMHAHGRCEAQDAGRQLRRPEPADHELRRGVTHAHERRVARHVRSDVSPPGRDARGQTAQPEGRASTRRGVYDVVPVARE